MHRLHREAGPHWQRRSHHLLHAHVERGPCHDGNHWRRRRRFHDRDDDEHDGRHDNEHHGGHHDGDDGYFDDGNHCCDDGYVDDRFDERRRRLSVRSFNLLSV